MTELEIDLGAPETVTRTYTNPVIASYLADPFVWKHLGVYYAIGTGPMEAYGQRKEGAEASSAFSAQFRIFPLYRSEDLANWTYVSGALTPPAEELGDSFWAPEVAFSDGVFYMYYSVGSSDKMHQLRVATSKHPHGPFTDTGKTLVNPAVYSFAIDAHPFQDDDGQWYLFFARDFLDTDDGAHAGTALMVDRMVDMTTLAGEPKTVLRARNEWQRFLADRTMYGETWDWHTLEGPSVLKHEGRYYCFYSGGRWETDQYGVDYGVADSVMGPYSDEGSEHGARILRTLEGSVFGPGHNSLVTGPDGETTYIVYHAWDKGWRARQMCIDQLIWTPEGPRCAGPTTTEQTIRVRLDPQSKL